MKKVGPVHRKHNRMPSKSLATFEHRGWEHDAECDASGIMHYLPKVTVELLHPDAKLPVYASEGDSGMDVFVVEHVIIAPGETVAVPLGFRMDIPRHPFHELGYRWEVQARPRGGVSLKTPLRIANSPGTIDNFYRGEFQILIHNTEQQELDVDLDRDDDTRAVHGVRLEPQKAQYARTLTGDRVWFDTLAGNGVVEWHSELKEGTVILRKGDKIAQLVFAEVIRPLEIVEGPVSTDTDRGEGRFGSTGVNG